DDRRRRPRRLVSLSDGHRPDVSVAPAVPRAAKRADDAARVRMDRRYVARARPRHRGEHRARRPRRAARQSDRVVALTTGGRRPVLTLAWVKPTAARTPGPQARLGDPPPDARGYARGLAFVDHRRAARRDEAPRGTRWARRSQRQIQWPPEHPAPTAARKAWRPAASASSCRRSRRRPTSPCPGSAPRSTAAAGA